MIARCLSSADLICDSRDLTLHNVPSDGVSQTPRSVRDLRVIDYLCNYAVTPFDMVDSAPMLSFEDKRWNNLTGGYKMPFDLRPSLRKLESQQDTPTAWEDLWEELHHQGDVGDASYAAVPELVRIHRNESTANWNLYAIVAIIELARTENGNPPLPDWLEDDYFRSIQVLAGMGAQEIVAATDPDTIRAILSVIAIAKGFRTHGRFLMWSEDELLSNKSE
jgi:hypothetical protein